MLLRQMIRSIMLVSCLSGAVFPLVAQDTELDQLRQRLKVLERANDSLKRASVYYQELSEANRKIALQQEELAKAQARIAQQEQELAQLKALQVLNEEEEGLKSEAGMSARSSGVVVNTVEVSPGSKAPESTFSGRSDSIAITRPGDSVDGLNEQIRLLSQKVDSLSAEIRKLRKE